MHGVAIVTTFHLALMIINYDSQRQYKCQSLAIDQPTGLYDPPQFFFDRTYLHDCSRHNNIYCMDGIVGNQ